MTSTDPNRPPGYKGTLPAREDRLARPWLITVAAIFLLVFVLSFLGIPSRFIPEPTPVPLPTSPPATETVGASPSPAPGASPVLDSPSPTPTAE